MSAAQVTEAHRGLAQNIMFYHTPKGSSTAQGVRDAAQLIADSEAKACDQLRAEVQRLKAASDKEDSMATTTINQRDRAEDAADKLASAILGEPIDWPDHDAKWSEALEEAECVHDLKASLSEMIAQSRVDSSVAGIAICNEMGAIARAERAEAELATANRKLDQILTDESYEGGVQYWIAKHDDGLLRAAKALAELAAERARLRKIALAACKEAQIKPMVWYPKGSGIDPNSLGMINQQQVDACLAAIDAAMQEGSK